MSRRKPISVGDHVTGPIGTEPPADGFGDTREARVKALRDALIAGDESGPPQPFDNAAFLARMQAKHIP